MFATYTRVFLGKIAILRCCTRERVGSSPEKNKHQHLGLDNVSYSRHGHVELLLKCLKGEGEASLQEKTTDV